MLVRVFGLPIQCLGLNGDREPTDAELLLVEPISQDCGQQLETKPCKDDGPDDRRHQLPLLSGRCPMNGMKLKCIGQTQGHPM